MILGSQIKDILNAALSNSNFSYVEFNQALDDFYDCSTPEDQLLICEKLGVSPKTLESYKVNLAPSQGKRILKYILYIYIKSHVRDNKHVSQYKKY